MAAPDVADLLARDVAGADGTGLDMLVRDAVVDVADMIARDAVVADGGARDTTAAADPFAGRSFRIDDMNPAPTPDPACTPTGPASAAQLTFSSDLTTLTGVASSGSTAFRFNATIGPESSRLTYHVTDLLGGQVFFERDQDVYVAQVVLYGSGVPVMWCLRGALTPQP